MSRKWLLWGAGALLLAGALAGVVLMPSASDTAAGFRPGWQILRPPHDVNALVLHEGMLLAGGRDGLTGFVPQSAEPGPLPPDTPEMTYVKALLVDVAGRLWVGYRGGLARFDGTGWTNYAVESDAPPGPVAALLLRRDGTLLAGGEAGLVAVTDTGFAPVDLPPDYAAGSVSALFEDRSGRLWVGLSSPTRGGLLVHDGADWRALGPEHGLVHRAINAIDEDASGHILVASGYSGRGGACRLETAADLSSWSCRTTADGLASDMVRLVHEDRFGQVWYGSEFRGLAVASGGNMLLFGPEDGMAGTELKAVLEDEDGNFWLGCDKGLTRIAADSTDMTQASGEN